MTDRPVFDMDRDDSREPPQDCSMCGGEGYDDCDDPIQCTRRHVAGLCPCSACGGTGNAADQTIW